LILLRLISLDRHLSDRLQVFDEMVEWFYRKLQDQKLRKLLDCHHKQLKPELLVLKKMCNSHIKPSEK
jgi:hypothetical protein